MLKDFFTFLLALSQGWGYWGVGALMAIESSFIPMPSEIIVPPAAYLASQGKMNIWLIILFAVIGSVIGALFNYALGYFLGRPLIYKLANHPIAKFLLLSPEKIKKAEDYFYKNSASATFIGRLIPVVRQLVSLPAGFSKMKLSVFIFYTALGSLLWSSLLAGLGYFIGYNQELLANYYHEISWVLIILFVLFIARRVYQAVNKKNAV